MPTFLSLPDTVIEAIERGTPAIRAIRQEAGRSQHDVAKEAGMPAERLNAIETGATPSENELQVLARVLGVAQETLHSLQIR